MKKNWLIPVLIVVIAALAWWIISYSKEINTQITQTTEVIEEKQDQTAEASGISIVETERNKKLWELAAEKALYEDKNALLINLSGKFYDQNGDVLLVFEAPEGNYTESTKNIVLKNGVTIYHPTEKILVKSETMSWSNQSKLITAEGKVEMIKEGLGTSYGNKAVFTRDFSKISIEGNTYSEFSFSG